MKERVGKHFLYIHQTLDGYFYEIQRQDESRIISSEIFEGPGRARLAAIGHVSMLEKGEEYDAGQNNGQRED